jgi:hypothetical protein
MKGKDSQSKRDRRPRTINAQNKVEGFQNDLDDVGVVCDGEPKLRMYERCRHSKLVLQYEVPQMNIKVEGLFEELTISSGQLERTVRIYLSG